MDKDDVAEFQKGESSNNCAKMRVEYINLLRANGLEIEIEVHMIWLFRASSK